MRTGKVDRIPNTISGGHIEVVHRDAGNNLGKVDRNAPPAGCNHTTETSVMPRDFSRGVPHLAIGRLSGTATRVRLVQLESFGEIATALQNDAGGIETNRLIRCQIEIVEFSKLQPWLPHFQETCEILASVYDWCEEHLGIPKRAPYTKPLTSGVVWATESNPRRRNPKFGKEAGWFGHVDIPENGHWDPGSLRLEPLFKGVWEGIR